MLNVCPEIFVKVILSGDDCHCIEPLYPERLIVVLLPEHIGFATGVAVPPVETELTITVATFDVADEQAPLVTKAR